MFATVISVIGLVHLVLVAAAVALFAVLVGICCPTWDEPYPRVVQYAYPSLAENHWFLMHVSRTALRTNWYVSSISEFVGARGTTSAKVMLLACSLLSLSSIYIQAILWYQDKVGVPVLVFTVISSIGLGMLGFVESSLQWAPLPVDWPDMESEEDTSAMLRYDQQLGITRLTSEEDDAIKARFKQLHTLSAFVFVAFQLSAQVYAQETSGLVVGVIGTAMFAVFSLMQWLSGANDDSLEEIGCLSPFAVVNMPQSQCCYCPQNGSWSNAQLKCISWAFISVEIIAFASLSSCPGWNALLM